MTFALIFHKASNQMAENFLFSRYYDTSADTDKFIVVYNLHLAIVQTLIAFIIGLFSFKWSDFFFNFSITKISIWIIISIVLNIRWLADWVSGFQVDRSATEKQFGLRFVTIGIAQSFLWVFGTGQKISWVELIAYVIMCIAAFYFHMFRVESELKIMDIEPTRPSTISMNVRYNSIYIPSNS